MFKILLICGSPRKGNTEYILSEVHKYLKKAGLKSELILLRKKKIRECTGRSKCQANGICEIQNDEVKEINQKFMEADYVVIGSPTYFNMISGLLKRWIDRTNPLYFKNSLSGKLGAIVAVGGAGRQSIGKAGENIKNFFNIFKITTDQIVLFEAEEADDAKNNPAYQKKIKEIANKIIKIM